MTRKKRIHRDPLLPANVNKLYASADDLNSPDGLEVPPNCPNPACQIGHVEEVKQAKQEWEATADLLSKIICLVDERGHILRANRTIERWGLGNVAEVRGRTMHELLHPNCHDVHCSLASFWETIPDMMGKNRFAEYQVDDRLLGRYLHLRFQPGQTSQGGSTKIQNHFGVAVVRDITDLKRAEEKLQTLNRELEQRVAARTAELLAANLRLQQEIDDHKRVEAELKRSREGFRLLVETMTEGLVICNQQGLISYVNDRFCEMIGHSREEIIGHPHSAYIETCSMEVWSQLIARVKEGLAVSDELKLKGVLGAEVWAKVSPSLLYDQDGEIVGSFAVVTDISDRIQTEQALLASKNQLRQLSEQVMLAQEKERQRVAAELHDGIGQTLSAVKFGVETGIKRIYDQPSEEAFRQFENIIPRIQDAIEEVRRISMALRPSILDDIGILATLSWFCRESGVVYKNLDIQLQLDVKEEDIPVQIKVVIFRIVQEALNNTVKHSQADSMRITLKYSDGTIELNIEDNGIGFGKERANANVNRGKGGLGLASMRERAELSGGLYSIKSARGKGTSIWVTWPL